MATLITAAGATISAIVEEYESVRETRSIVHTILSNPDPDITLRPSGRRTGTLTLAFINASSAEVDSLAAESALAAGMVCTLTSDKTSINMAFVRPAGGRLRRAIGATRGAWRVTFDWQEVPS